MKEREPRAGEPVQVCVHISRCPSGVEPDEHWWNVPNRPWIVLCAQCHADYQLRKGVEIYGAVFAVPEGVKLDAGTSCVTHARPR